jgi:hypothetical protein
MKKYLVLLTAVVFMFNCKANAQLLKPIPLSYFQDKGQTRISEKLEITRGRIFSVNTLNTNAGMQWNFKYTLPKGAIFCRMEDAIYNKLNFWVKIRMGTDEKYSN